MKKSGILLLLSPVFVLFLWIIVSLIFWLISNVFGDIQSLIAIKSLINRILGILALISIPVLIVGIVLLAKNKDSKLNSKEIIDYSRQKSKKYMTRYLLGFAIFVFLQFLSSYFDDLNKLNPNVWMSIAAIVIMFLNRWIVLGLIKISLNIVYENKYTKLDLFCGLDKTIKYIIANIITSVITVVGLILLIVPGVIRGFRLSMVPYIILQDGLGPIAAIQKSRKITKGYVGDIFIINILAGLINILGLIALFVGLLWTIPLYMIANAYIYKKLIDFGSKLDSTDNINLTKPISKVIPKKSKISKSTNKSSIKKKDKIKK